MSSDKKQISQSMRQLPHVEGPIEVTESSHPFSSMAFARVPLDLAKLGYVEEEYFLSGTANVYDSQDNGEINVIESNLPYKTRIMVRKPETSEKFSGRVFLDIYNASNGYDIEDVWRRSWQHYIENGDIYIGISSKPINALSLKNFDYKRYESLNWASNHPAPQPSTASPTMSIPGTEEGLFWDMLTQLGGLIRSGQAPFLSDYQVDYLCLTGQSQSGMYLNTYVHYFHSHLREVFDTPLFDSYLTVVGAGVMRNIRQYDNAPNFGALPQKLKYIDVPFILLSSQGDIELFKPMGPDYTAINDKNQSWVRHYELAAAPHTDPASVLIPSNEEVAKTKNPPRILDGEYSYTVNNIQLAYYVNSCLEWLYRWVKEGKTAPQTLLLERDQQGVLKTDQYGHGLGGLRSPYVDIPIAYYHANAIEKESDKGQVGNVNGSMEYFSKEMLEDLYKGKEDYLEQFARDVNQQIDNQWLTAKDGERMIQQYKDVANKVF